jgi:hypothetical protein
MEKRRLAPYGVRMSFHRVLRVCAFLAFAAALLPVAGAQAGAKRPVVVELYTSQGCDSCPPADALLGQLATRKDVIALSMPITYWDMLGWKDTLASDSCTRRQKSYAQVMKRGGVYTPQMIVDGVTDVVGSRDALVNAAIAARQADEENVPVALTATKQSLHIVIGADDHADANAAGGATIWLFRVQPWAKIVVGGGENGGRTLTYTNSVRDIHAVGLWNGHAVTLDLPRDVMSAQPHDTFAVVVQEGGGYGRIVGAAMSDSAH